VPLMYVTGYLDSIPMELTPTRTRIILFQTLVTYKPRESTYIVIFSALLHHILSTPCCPCIYYSLLATLVIALSDFKFFAAQSRINWQEQIYLKEEALFSGLTFDDVY
jgi:hypothetical protein